MTINLNLTHAAATQIKRLTESENVPYFRVRVDGGGCSGFQYGFSFDDEYQDDDTLTTKDGVTVVIDGLSYQYLVGSTVDYLESLTGSQFVVENPNASSTCGCGSSFSL